MDTNIDLNVRNVLRVALYVRVSSQEQAEEGYSVGEQTDRLKKYADAMGWNVYKVYVDPGYSGGNIDRPGLSELIKDVERGEIDKVVVYKLDRLSRSQFDTLYLIEKVFLTNNTDFVSMTENFNTSSPLGRAMIGFLAVFAQLEKDKINERMVMGKEARAKEGKWGGGSTVPIGYDYNIAKDLLEVNEYEAMQIREIYDLFLQGVPLRTIETMFLEKGYKHKHGVWRASTIRALLGRKTHLGYIKYANEWYKGEHDPIVDEEIWNKAFKLLTIRREEYKASGIKPRAKKSYLGGLLVCKQCGAKYTRQTGKKSKTCPQPLYYCCHSRCKKVKAMIKDPNCKNKNWYLKELDDLVLGEIRKLATDPEYMTTIRDEKRKKAETPNKIDIIREEIENIDAQISRFMDLYGIGKFTIDQVSGKVDPLNEQKRGLEQELTKLNAETDRMSEEETLEIIESFGEILDSGELEDIQNAIESLINYIELDNDDVYIHWKFA